MLLDPKLWWAGKRGLESGTGTPGSLGGPPFSKEEAAVTQLLPAAVEILSSESQAARPQPAPPWGLDRESKSMCVLWPTVRLLLVPPLAEIWERIQVCSPEG